MRHKAGSILLSCVMGAALLSGCTVTISPTTPAASSDSAVSTEQETEETPSPSTPASAESPMSTPATHSPEGLAESQLTEIDDQTLITLKEISQDGYEFYKECQIGQEGILDFDLNNQFFQGEQQYIALASIQSREDFLIFCEKFYSDNFINQNITPWFEGNDAQFVEQQGFLYYRTPSGTGLVIPLAESQAEIEQQTADEVSINFPFWDPKMQKVTNGGVQITLLKIDQVWKIDKIEEHA